MNISIIGSGSMAHGIGTRLSQSGNKLIIYDRKLEKALELATKLGNNTQAQSSENPIEGDIVILALPYQAVLDFVQARKEELKNKIVVDISNPVNFQTFELIPPAGTSGAELIAQTLPKEVRLVKAFNTVSAGTLVTGKVAGNILDVFVVGDDQGAKDTLKKIINESGMRAIDAGPLAHARHLEGFSLIHILIQQQLGTSFMSAIKILS